jgi:histidine ammonia-lyase
LSSTNDGAEVGGGTPPPAPLVVTGGPLALAAILEVAEDHRPVEIASGSRARVAAAFEVVLDAARAGLPVYGLTTGVGWNKDQQPLRPAGALEPDLLAASRRFNIGTLRAHAAGIGPLVPDAIVRAAMLVRLNLLLTGSAGAQPAVVDQYAAFLNCDLTPVVPGRGSIGEADILLSSHIGLALAGEWQVRSHGEVLPAARALEAAALKPVDLVGKDFLAIVGDNSLTIAEAIFAVRDARAWLEREITVFALSLEGLDGNVAPFLEASVAARPRPGFVAVVERLRAALGGSDLWLASAKRPLQDPLSFRTMPIVLGNAWEALAAAEAELSFEVCHSADNPRIVLDAPAAAAGTQAARYRVPGPHAAAIVPTANFEALPLVSALERASLALAHVSKSIATSVLRFENPAITGLPRYLTAPGNSGHGFGAIQKAVAALDVEIKSLAMPVSLENATLAGNIEDMTNNGPLTVARLRALVEDLYPLASLQLLHAAQAVDLRTDYRLGARTRTLRDGYRARVPFVAQDRILTPDLEAGVQYLREFAR